MLKHGLKYFLLIFLLCSSIFPYDAVFSPRMANYHSVRYIYSMTQSPDKTYFATNSGIIVYSHLQRLWDPPHNISKALPADDIRTVFYHETTGYLWASAGRALYILYSESMPRWEKVMLPEVCSRIGSADDRLFAGTDRGIVELNPFTGAVSDADASLPAHIEWSVSGIEMDIYSVQFTGDYFVDRDMALVRNSFLRYPMAFSVYGDYSSYWIGTLGNGLYTGDRSMLMTRHEPYGLLGNRVTALLVSDDDIFIGHEPDYSGPDDRNGWTETHPDFQVFRWVDDYTIPALKTSPVRGFVLRGDTVLAVTDNRIIYHNPVRSELYTMTPDIGLIDGVSDVAVNGNHAWAVAETGVFHIDPVRLFIRPESELPRYVRCADADSKELVIGGDFGIRVYTAGDSGRQLIRVWEGNRRSVDKIILHGNTISWAEGDELVLSDRLFSRIRRRRLPAAEYGLQITDLEIAGGRIWAGTNKGLFSLDLSTEMTNRLTEAEGLCSNHILTLASGGNKLYIGTERGMTVYEYFP